MMDDLKEEGITIFMGCGVAAMQAAQVNTGEERKGVWFCINASYTRDYTGSQGF